MKQFLILLVISVFSLATLPAQEAFYFAPQGHTLLLDDNPQSLCVHFYASVDLEHELRLTHSEVDGVRNIARKHESWALIDFTRSQAQTAPEMALALGLDPANLKSAHWGYKIEGKLDAWLSHRILYKLKPQTSATEWESYLQGFEGVSLEQTPTGIPYIEVEKLSLVLAYANQMAQEGLVEYAQPDFITGARSMSPTPVYPTDTYFGNLYYLHNTGQNVNFFTGTADVDIDAPEAWCTNTGSSSITIAVIDEGAEPHEDLETTLGASRVLNGYTTSNPTQNPGGGPQNAGDAHGQAVAGVIAASHDNVGVSGVCPECMLLPIHVFTKTAPVSEFADAINYARLNGADIINNSWVFDQCTGSFAAIETEITNAQSLGRGGLGCLVFFSSGQEVDGTSAGVYDCVAYPANLANVISVGALNPKGKYPGYANYGSDLDLVAPSSNISVNNVTTIDRMGALGYNVDGTPSNFTNLNYTKWFGGTSVACAEASGVAALILTKNNTLTHTQVRFYMEDNTTVPAGTNATADQLGNGMINANDALAATPAPGGFPVEFLSFEASFEKDEILLTWLTGSESNNDYFSIEKKQGANYLPIGSVAGAGTVNDLRSYQFIDFSPSLGTNQYRLRQVDLDGSSTFSSVVSIEVSDAALGYQIRTAPNPVSTELEVSLMGLAGQALHYQVLTLQGQLITQGQFQQAPDQFRISTAEYAPGAYLLRIMSQESHQSQVKKIMVTR